MKAIKYLSLIVLFVSFISCEEKEVNPKITTSSITALSASRFYVEASVSEKGNIPIVDYGFVYYIGPSSPYSGSGMETKVSLGKALDTDVFSTTIVIENVNYYYDNYSCYVRAYLTNEKGTVYGKPLSAAILRLQATNIIPASAKTGDTVVISGTNFSTELTDNIVTFNNVAGKVVEATSTNLKVVVPTGITTNWYDSYILVKVKSGGQTIDLNYNFTLAPSPTGFSPKNGTWGTTITIYGNALNNSTVYFNDVYTSYYSSSGNSITVNVPSEVKDKSFKLYIKRNGEEIEVPGGSFTMDKMQVYSFTPRKVLQGSSITVTAGNYHPSYDKNKLHIGNYVLSSNYYSSLSYTIPTSLSKGEYTAYVSNGIDTVALPQKVEIVQPEITSVTPSSGYAGTKITVSGLNFRPGSTSLYLDDYYFWPTSSDSTTIKATVPFIEPGTYKLKLNINSTYYDSDQEFTVLAPSLSSVTPSTGSAGNSVIINGEGFGTSTSNVRVLFGSIYADVMSISNTQINVKVPSSITSGSWMVKVIVNSYEISNTLTFTVP